MKVKRAINGHKQSEKCKRTRWLSAVQITAFKTKKAAWETPEYKIALNN